MNVEKIAVVLLVGFSALAGVLVSRDVRAYRDLAPERAVIALPGVGPGWVDTLRHITGHAEIDTLTRKMIDYYDGALAGLYEHWYDRVRLNTHMRAYIALARAGCSEDRGWGHVHPLEIASPSGVLAHEFGHRFQAKVRAAYPEAWARVPPEVFADRFALAMLAIRGWVPRSETDVAMYRLLKHRLRMDIELLPW